MGRIRELMAGSSKIELLEDAESSTVRIVPAPAPSDEPRR
jgi:hypothetical protein